MDDAGQALGMNMAGGLIARAAALAAAAGVTAPPSPHTIGFVISRTAKTLTKRRAVDFCRVATAICPRSALP